jgi:hypothetical protein
MKTDAERLQFVVRFAQMDLSTLRRGDWFNLLEDLETFLISGEADRWEDSPELNRPSVSTGGFFVFIRDWMGGATRQNHEELQALQTETLAILSAVVCGQQTGTLPLNWVPETALTVKTRVMNIGSFDHSRNRNILLVNGAPRDVFIFMLQLLLIREPTNRICVCPECRTLFYRIGKQQYCTRACSNRVNVRTWRQREDVKHAEADRAHTRYVNKQNPKIRQKVKRKPRKREVGNGKAR